MGKRRQELDHKTREQMEQETDEEDEIVEENCERVINDLFILNIFVDFNHKYKKIRSLSDKIN